MFVGIDIGSNSVKVLAFSEQLHFKASGHYPKWTSPFEHDPEVVSSAVQNALQKLIREHHINVKEIKGIGLSGHGPSILFIDAKGSPLTPIVTWQDRRSLEEAQRMRHLWKDFEKDGTSLEAKLFWFWRHHPELFAPGNTALDPKSYLGFLLCQTSSIDLSTASTIYFYNRKEDDWQSGATGIQLSVMPPVYPSWESIGATGTSFSRSCGLPDGIPVYPGGIDAFCEAVGAGGFSDGVVVDGSGTSTCLSRVVPIDDTKSLHVLPNSAISIEMMSATGASYKWFGECFDGVDLTQLNNEVNPSRPVNLLFLPYLSGERSPVWDEKARGLFIGMDLQTKGFEMLQALFQGVAFGVRQNLATMGDNIHTVRAVGGANRNDKWLQIKANVCKTRYMRMEEEDASAFGAALIASVGSGKVRLDELESYVKPAVIFEPEQAPKAQYDRLYELYESLYDRIQETYHDLYGCAIHHEGDAQR